MVTGGRQNYQQYVSFQQACSASYVFHVYISMFYFCFFWVNLCSVYASTHSYHVLFLLIKLMLYFCFLFLLIPFLKNISVSPDSICVLFLPLLIQSLFLFCFSWFNLCCISVSQHSVMFFFSVSHSIYFCLHWFNLWSFSSSTNSFSFSAHVSRTF